MLLYYTAHTEHYLEALCKLIFRKAQYVSNICSVE